MKNFRYYYVNVLCVLIMLLIVFGGYVGSADVTGVNDNSAPVFTEGNSTTRSVAENTRSGANIGSAVAATDADRGDKLTYSLNYFLRGTDVFSFSISSKNGQLRTRTPLDYETKTSYTVPVKVSDGKGGTDSITVTINVTDVNENRAPVFTEGTRTTRSVAENTSSGQKIGTAVSAVDPDDDPLTCSLGGTDASSFGIDRATGQLRTKTPLDYETKTSYTVTVEVSDGKGGTDSITVTINVTDVNDNRAPVFTDGTSTTRSVAENTGSGQKIGTAVSAADPDDDTLTYSLGGTDASSFGINSTTGQLRTNAVLDYETKASYTVTVSVSDGVGGSDSITVTINVTDVDNSAPVFSDGTSTTRSIAENTASGQNIGTAVGATDADGNTLSYSLGGIDVASFSIVSTSGQLQTREALDYETKTSYTVTVSVSDGEGGSDSITVTINVTDVDDNSAPVFSDGTSTTRSIAENTASGQNIGTAVGATDADGNTLSYSLGGIDVASFSIVSTSGQLQTREALDYETKTSYTVAVSVSDGEGGTDSITVTINVTDVDEIDPPLSERTQEVQDAIVAAVPGVNSADNVTAAHLTTINSLDFSFKGITTLQNGDFDGLTALTLLRLSANSLSDISPLENLTKLTTLTLNHNTSLSDVSPLENLTRLTTLELSHNSISDISPLDDLTKLTTLELSANSLSDISALENLTNLTTLYLSANSLSDISPLDDLTKLTLLTLNNNNIIDISALENLTNLTHLWLSANSITDYGPLRRLIAAIEADGRSLWIDITIPGETDNNAPMFTDGESTTRSVAKNTAAGENIGSAVEATDADSDDTLTYSLSGTDAALFSIVSTSGQLQTSEALDDETSYTVIVSVSDGNSGTDSITVTINVIDEVTIDPPISERTQEVQDAIVDEAGVSDAADVTAAHLAAITYLDLSYALITSLKAGDFDGLTALTELDLDSNSISDISPLDGLTSLTWLYLSGNDIIDISALAGLTNLTELYLDDNSISDISPLAGLTKLATLYLDDNSITNYGPLRTLIAAIEADSRTLDLDITIPDEDNNGAPAPASVPMSTSLLANYPNPFNPETWIPYQLSKSVDVTLTIYNMRGVVVRQLELGQKPAGAYLSRSRAIHWDGRNSIGEKVVAGVYFYTLTAGDFTATRKMLIMK